MALLLATFAELYRQEIGAEEDVHRALPFFGTALGIVVGSIAYAAGRLPRWPDVAAPGGRAAVLLFLSRAMARRNYRRIGPVAVLRAKAGQDGNMQRALLDSYTEIIPFNRELNQRRQRFRALASSHLIRSLIWALGATTVIFVADKLGCFAGSGL